MHTNTTYYSLLYIIIIIIIIGQGFSVAFEPVLELAFVDQADLKLTEIRLCLPSAV